MDSISYEDLTLKTNILSIPCSLSNLLKVEILTEVERECKQTLNAIINHVELDILYDLNKKHFPIILFNQDKLYTNYMLSSKFPLNLNENTFYVNNIVLTKDNICNIYNQTMAQSSSDIWKICRDLRISASVKAHKIKTCRNRTSENLNKLANSLLKESNLGKTGNMNVKYGQITEPIAFDEYQKLYEVEVLKAGLIIHYKMPWICRSPDGLVLQNGKIERVLEIKCPISCKNNK